MANPITYSYSFEPVTPVANQVIADFFNASGSGKICKVNNIEFYVKNTANVVGITIAIEVVRTSAVGTGGSVITGDKVDTNNANIPAQITCRSLPTGGATTVGLAVSAGNINTDEITQQPQTPFLDNDGSSTRQQLTLRVGEGFKLVQGPFGTIGKIGWRFDVTFE